MLTSSDTPNNHPRYTRQGAAGRDGPPLVAATNNDRDLSDKSGKIAYTVAEAIEASGLGRTTIYALLKSGSLRKIKVGTRTLIFKNDLVDLLEQATTTN